MYHYFCGSEFKSFFLVLFARGFLKEKGGDCVRMSARKGSAKTLQSLALVWGGLRLLVLSLPSPINTIDVIGSEVKAYF